MYGIRNREGLPPEVVEELDQLVATLKAVILKEHNEDGSHLSTTLVSATHPDNAVDADDEGAPGGGTGATDASRWWKGKGAWIFDDSTAADKHQVVIAPPNFIAGTTYDNYAPPGIDTCVGMVVSASGSGNVTITGMQAIDQKRMLFILNDDSSSSIIFKHDNTGSLEANRFRLPGNEDVEVGPNQVLWLYYSTNRKRWVCSITKHEAGGLASTGELLTANFTLTEAQIEAADVTPIDIIAAQGSGLVAIVIGIAMQTTVTTAYSTAPNWQVRYSGVTTDLVAVMPSGLSVAGPSFRTTHSHPSGLQVNHVTAANTNVAVQLSLTAAPGTPGTGVATAKGQIWYVVWDTN